MFRLDIGMTLQFASLFFGSVFLKYNLADVRSQPSLGTCIVHFQRDMTRPARAAIAQGASYIHLSSWTRVPSQQFFFLLLVEVRK